VNDTISSKCSTTLVACNLQQHDLRTLLNPQNASLRNCRKMKTYIIEPSRKKSVCEVELWRKGQDCSETDKDDRRSEWNGPILRKECWWRWAEWTLEIPETDAEISKFLEDKGFATLQYYLEYHCADTIEEAILPCEDEDELILPIEVECNFCWDGQGEEFKVKNTRKFKLSEEERSEIENAAKRVFYEEGLYEAGLEELGWDHYSTIYEICCAVRVKLRDDQPELELEESLPNIDSLVISSAQT
jgi:hypothetical protein